MKLFKRSLPIRLKVILIILVSIFLLSVMIFAISNTLLLESYSLLEKSDAISNTRRVRDAFDNSINQLEVKLADWAWWDDTYEFVIDNNLDYAESNLGASSIANLKINGMIFTDKAGEVVFAKMINWRTSEEIPAGPFLDYLKQNPELLIHKDIKRPVSGLIFFDDTLALVAAHNILPSSGEGESRGNLLFIKFLDDLEVRQLSTLTHLDVQIALYEDTKTTDKDILLAKDNFLLSSPEATLVLGPEEIAGYSLINDPSGAPLAILKVLMHRDIYLQGIKTFRLFTVIVGLFGAFFGVLILLLLERFVISRLELLTQQIRSITQGQDNLGRVKEHGDDELGVLSKEINLMLDRISGARLDLEKFKLAVDGVGHHVVITDPEGVILYANSAAQMTTGYSLTEMKGRTPSLWGGRMPKKLYEEFWRTIKVEKKTFVGEFKNVRKNGVEYVASAVVTPILKENGEVAFFVGLEKDISYERKLEEERAHYTEQLHKTNEIIEQEVKVKTKELQAEKARFLASVNSLQMGFAIIENDGGLLVHNPALGVIIGDSDDRLRTLDGLSLRLGAGVDLMARLSECIDKRCTVHIAEIVVGRKYLRLFMTPVFLNGSDESLGGVLLLEDITEAKAIDRAKSEFVSLASHQLRTPLSTINWYIEILASGEAGKLSKDQKNYLQEILVGSKRMVSLVNSLLDVSRLELGNIKLTPEDVNIKNLAAEVVGELQPKVAEQKLKLTEDYDDFVMSVDEKYLRMVIQNIFTNSVKYTPEGGAVTVSVKKIRQGGQFGGKKMPVPTCGFSVSDTGYGIPLAQQSRVFQKLFRGDNVVDKDEEGTGLGLYIVKSIVEQMRGEVWFVSEEGKGSTFYVTLPLRDKA